MTNNIQGNSHKVNSWFLSRNSISQKGVAMIYLKWWKGRTYNQDYSTRQIKSFTDKQKLREFSSYITNDKGTSLSGKHKRRKGPTETNPKQENANRNIHIDNYFKCEWIKCSNQKTQACWIGTKTDPYICCLQETHFRPRDTYRLKVRRWKKLFHANGNQKKSGVAILR